MSRTAAARPTAVSTQSTQTLRSPSRASDHAPAATNDLPTIIQGSGPTTVDVLANDNDPDGDPLTIVGISQGSRGHVAIAADRKSLTYDPTGSLIGTDLFTYSVSDGRGGTAVGTVLVTVVKDTIAPIATAPVAWITTRAVGTTASIVVTFSGTDVGMGIKNFQLSESRNNGALGADARGGRGALDRSGRHDREPVPVPGPSGRSGRQHRAMGQPGQLHPDPRPGVVGDLHRDLDRLAPVLRPGQAPGRPPRRTGRSRHSRAPARRSR